MSIPVSIDPLGSLGEIEIISRPTLFTKEIQGVPAAGITSSSSDKFRVTAKFDLAHTDRYPKYYFLFSLWGTSGERRYLFCTQKNNNAMYCENNTGVYGAVHFDAGKSTGNVLAVFPDKVVYNGVVKALAGRPDDTGFAVRPSFFGNDQDFPFLLESFALEIDGVVRQNYVPARRHGELGLYETISKTFCK